MTRFTIYAVVVMVIVAAASSVDATINCYTCSTVSDSSCNDPFKGAASVATCSGQTCTKVYGTFQGSSVVARSCSSETGDNTCIDYNLGGLVGKICTCTGDKCNTASRKLAPGRVAVAALASLAAAWALIAGRLP